MSTCIRSEAFELGAQSALFGRSVYESEGKVALDIRKVNLKRLCSIKTVNNWLKTKHHTALLGVL